jgi:hypothetical protein
MDDGQNLANDDLVEQYEAIDDQIDGALMRTEQMRDRAMQIRRQSTRLREQAGIACKEAQALIDTFPHRY